MGEPLQSPPELPENPSALLILEFYNHLFAFARRIQITLQDLHDAIRAEQFEEAAELPDFDQIQQAITILHQRMSSLIEAPVFDEFTDQEGFSGTNFRLATEAIGEIGEVILDDAPEIVETIKYHLTALRSVHIALLRFGGISKS